ncbi:hypothetical protein RRG08_060161 [Elysia crispata]|uniref:Uncharacterized protein n=1 Tax=Elysia crispata TaxID=231223 RepID=A0AAE0ZZ24_9GAST|nr:hypothetical protein RRG08_060161 [Elysia crispata]
MGNLDFRSADAEPGRELEAHLDFSPGLTLGRLGRIGREKPLKLSGFSLCVCVSVLNSVTDLCESNPTNAGYRDCPILDRTSVSWGLSLPGGMSRRLNQCEVRPGISLLMIELSDTLRYEQWGEEQVLSLFGRLLITRELFRGEKNGERRKRPVLSHPLPECREDPGSELFPSYNLDGVWILCRGFHFR